MCDSVRRTSSEYVRRLRLTQCGKSSAQAERRIDDAIACHDPERRFIAHRITYKFHTRPISHWHDRTPRLNLEATLSMRTLPARLETVGWHRADQRRVMAYASV